MITREDISPLPEMVVDSGGYFWVKIQWNLWAIVHEEWDGPPTGLATWEYLQEFGPLLSVAYRATIAGFKVDS